MTKSNITAMKINSKMRDTASEQSKEMGVLKHSIAKGKGNMYGFLGEALFKKYASPFYKVETHNTYDYDFVLDEKIRVDVKTKSTSTTPKGQYDCSVAAYNTKQKCDAYVFCRVMHSFDRGFILGGILKEDFFDKAQFWKKGTIDPSNGYQVKADCYNIKIDELHTLKELMEECMKNS